MLPRYYVKDDEKWIREQLSKLPAAYRQKAIDGYSRVLINAYALEPLEHVKENAARFTANTRLRHYIARVHESIGKI